MFQQDHNIRFNQPNDDFRNQMQQHAGHMQGSNRPPYLRHEPISNTGHTPFNSQQIGVLNFHNRPQFSSPPPDFPFVGASQPSFNMGNPRLLTQQRPQFVGEAPPNRHSAPQFPSNLGIQHQGQNPFQRNLPQMPPLHINAYQTGSVPREFESTNIQMSSHSQFAKPAPLPMYSVNFESEGPKGHSSYQQQGTNTQSEFSNFQHSNTEGMIQSNRHSDVHFNQDIEHQSFDMTKYDENGDVKSSFDKYQREKDQCWMENWLKRNGKLKSSAISLHKKQSSECSSGPKLYEVQQAFHKSIIFLAKLQQQCRSLESIATSADPQVWKAEKNLTEEYKDKCIELYQYLNDGEMLDQVKQKIASRKKKRAWLKKQRREANEEREAGKERREMIHRQLNDWRNQMAQLAEDEKQKAELKKSADSTLSSVRKKIADAKKTQEFLKAFQKLRKIRRVAAINQGRYASDVYDVNFEKKMDELTKLMTSQQSVYESEEKTLKVMLEAVEEETRERDKEIKLQKERAKERRERKLNHEKVFGKNTVISEEDELYPFHSYYTQAEQSLEALVQIRHEWDMHLVLPSVAAGSRIPDGFILPSEPTSDIWASALK